MTKPLFFRHEHSLTIGEIAAMTGAVPGAGVPSDRRISNIASLERAGPADLTFFDKARFTEAMQNTRAGACLVAERLAHRAPSRVPILTAREPYRAFVAVARMLFPDAMRPSSLFQASDVSTNAFVHPDARLESGVAIDPGAVVGPGAEIGTGTVIGPTAVIGPGVRIGRDCMVAAGVTVTNALVGDRVVIHPGCRIGQDGFGYHLDHGHHSKIPQIGRVIIQDDVEIGAGSTIDRGAIHDTVIGEGTKIDNLVQVGHNVVIGRHCILVAQTGLSGSVTLEDWVMLGGQVGIADHLTVGEGAQIGASSGVMHNVPAGAKWIGTPAKPARDQFREFAAVSRLAERRGRTAQAHASDDTDTDGTK